MKKHLISIIVPAYQVEKYIDDCLNSLINQTYKNIEIILINDGSTDKTGEICERFSKTDKRIKYVCKKNEGVSKARNVGLDLISGDYVLFVDSDDWIELNTIEKLIDNINDMDVLQFNMIKNNPEGIVVKKFSNFEPRIMSKEDILLNVVFPDMFEKKYGFYGESRSVGAKLYKSEVVRFVRFNENMKFYEDGEFLLKVINDSTKYISKDLLLYHYRCNSSSCTQAFRSKMYEESQTVIEELSKVQNITEKKELIDYIKLDMFCLNINNILKSNTFNYKVIKKICMDEVWNIKKLKVKLKYCHIARKLLFVLVKCRSYFLAYLLCKLKRRQIKV